MIQSIGMSGWYSDHHPIYLVANRLDVFVSTRDLEMSFEISLHRMHNMDAVVDELLEEYLYRQKNLFFTIHFFPSNKPAIIVFILSLE